MDFNLSAKVRFNAVYCLLLLIYFILFFASVDNLRTISFQWNSPEEREVWMKSQRSSLRADWAGACQRRRRLRPQRPALMPPPIEIGQTSWVGESQRAEGGLVSPGGETIKPRIHIRLKCNRVLETLIKALGLRLKLIHLIALLWPTFYIALAFSPISRLFHFIFLPLTLLSSHQLLFICDFLFRVSLPFLLFPQSSVFQDGSSEDRSVSGLLSPITTPRLSSYANYRLQYLMWS